METITLKKDAQRKILSGNLWVFSNETGEIPKSVKPGEIVEFHDFRGNFAGRGFVNKNSLIRCRFLTFKEDEINAEFFAGRVEKALAFRKQFFPDRASLRIVFSESDFLPGLIVDKYEDVLVLQNFCLGMEGVMPAIIAALKDALRPAALYQKSAGYFRTLEGMPDVCRWEYGEKKMPLVIDEWGLKYSVDVITGHKTGFYFDQSENHHFIRTLAGGKTVLDCFSYTGGFALNAASGGAEEVVAVEESASAVRIAEENASINRLKGIKFVADDVFHYLENTHGRYDLIILDPPSFTKSQKTVPSALKGYEKLNELAFRRAAPGGLVLSASCSHHIKREDFLGAVRRAAADSGRIVRLLGWRGASADHPVYVPMPETEYLKMAVLAVE
jgi:23S rRNA (cytosine1962-C5)-methyltransferase